MELSLAQEAFVRLLGQLQPDAKIQFLDWVRSEYGQPVEQENEDMEEQESDLLENIAADLRDALPPNAIATGEKQIFPKTGPNSDLDPATTLHVDSFLYPTDEDVDRLCDRMGISRSYCLQCGSWKTAPLSFISHSMSREQLKYIFCSLLPDLSGKTVLDIGSRLGSVLYGGYLYSHAASLVGVEVNTHLCELQQKVVAKYSLGTRVHVVCSDVRNQSELVAKANVIILNYAFEFFLQPEEQARLWEFLYAAVRKKGTLLVTVPSIQDCWLHLPFTSPLILDGWVVEISSGVDPNDEELSDVHLYCIV